MEQEQKKHFLKQQSRQTTKRQRSWKTKALKIFLRETKPKKKKKIRKAQSLERLFHNVFIKMLLFGKRHYCKGFQINHNCFPRSIHEFTYHICHFWWQLVSFVVVWVLPQHASPSVLFSSPFVCSEILTYSQIYTTGFPFFVAPLLFQLQDKNLRISKTRILDILESRTHPLPPAPRPLMQS